MKQHEIEVGFGRLVDVTASGRLLGVSRWTVRELIAKGQLEHVRLGRRVLVSVRALEALVRRRTRGAGSPPPDTVRDARRGG